MQHQAYPNTLDIRSGTVISIAAETLSPGHTLALEFPNNARAPASVLLATSNELQIEAAGKKWALRPYTANDGQLHVAMPTGMKSTNWTVQAELS